MLISFIPTFNSANNGSVDELERFWDHVETQFFAAWPERAVHYPETPMTEELSLLGQALVNHAIKLRCKVYCSHLCSLRRSDSIIRSAYDGSYV